MTDDRCVLLTVLVAALDVPAAPVVALMGFGVLMAMVGHGAKSPALVATGLAVLFLATAAMFVGGLGAYRGEERDERPEREFPDPSAPRLDE